MIPVLAKAAGVTDAANDPAGLNGAADTSATATAAAGLAKELPEPTPASPIDNKGSKKKSHAARPQRPMMTAEQLEALAAAIGIGGGDAEPPAWVRLNRATASFDSAEEDLDRQVLWILVQGMVHRFGGDAKAVLDEAKWVSFGWLPANKTDMLRRKDERRRRVLSDIRDLAETSKVSLPERYTKRRSAASNDADASPQKRNRTSRTPHALTTAGAGASTVAATPAAERQPIENNGASTSSPAPPVQQFVAVTEDMGQYERDRIAQINKIMVFFGGLGFDTVRLNPVADLQERKRQNLASRDSRLLRELNKEARTGGAVHKVRQQAVKEMKEEVSREATSQEMGDAASAVGAVAPKPPDIGSLPTYDAVAQVARKDPMRAGAMVINLDVVHEARYGELPGVWLRIRSRILKYDPNKPYLKLVRETRRADTGAVVQIKEQPPQWWADLLEKRIELEFAEYEGGQPRPAKGRHFDGRWRFDHGNNTPNQRTKNRQARKNRNAEWTRL